LGKSLGVSERSFVGFFADQGAKIALRCRRCSTHDMTRWGEMGLRYLLPANVCFPPHLAVQRIT
jgi:hypothetical protein